MTRGIIPKTSRRYKKIFIDENIANQAKKMLMEGRTLHYVAGVFNIDHTSVRSFRQRCEKEGVIFPPLKGRGKNVPIQEIIIEFGFCVEAYDDDGSVINQGKSYAEYMAESRKRGEFVPQKRIEEAKKTIKKVHEFREKNGLVWKTEYDTAVY